ERERERERDCLAFRARIITYTSKLKKYSQVIFSVVATVLGKENKDFGSEGLRPDVSRNLCAFKLFFYINLINN
ncbi:MAG: hypothetical protein LBF85_06980, partial [Tannerella sp.]|nr:hypothetical protein [Tannerella sp.]